MATKTKAEIAAEADAAALAADAAAAADPDGEVEAPEAASPEGQAQVNAIDLIGTAAPVGEPDYARFVVRPLSRGEDREPSYEVWDLVDERRADGPFEYQEDAEARAALVAVHKAREVK